MGRATARTCEPHSALGSTPVAASSERPPARASQFATASHTDLFEEASVRRCDVCGDPLDPADAEEHGTGVYVWARGDEVRREEAPLCASCGGGIIASMFGMFDFDDEE